MRASSELHLRSVWSFPFDFQSTPPREGALVYGLSLLMLPFSGDFHPSFHRHARRNPSNPCSPVASPAGGSVALVPLAREWRTSDSGFSHGLRANEGGALTGDVCSELDGALLEEALASCGDADC